MVTLHIEHPITDLETWLGAFSRFEQARRQAGVRDQRIRQPIDDDHYIYVELDFDDAERAIAFKRFLERNVWATPDASPALAGKPIARVIADIDPRPGAAAAPGSG